MNDDKNDVALDQAPASVDGQKVLSVLQVTISDNPAEDGYKVLLANAETATVSLDEFTAGAVVTTEESQPAETVTSSVEQPQLQPEQVTDQVPQPVAPLENQTNSEQVGVTQ